MGSNHIFRAEEKERLNKPERKATLPPETIVKVVDPKPGEAIAEVGVGTGYCLLPIVKKVSGQGEFMGVDSQQRMLDGLAENLESFPYANSVHQVLTQEDSLALASDSTDTILICSTYHELPEQSLYGKELYRVLKAEGKLVIIDWKPLQEGQERVAGPPAHHRVSVESAIEKLSKAGFGQFEEVDAFEHLWTLVVRK